MSQMISGTVDISGPSFQAVTSGTVSSPGVITRDGALTIVLAAENTSPTTSFIQLPPDASVGDVVEVYPTPDESGGGWSINVVPASTDHFWFSGESSGVGAPSRFLKIASDAWAATHLSVP